MNLKRKTATALALIMAFSSVAVSSLGDETGTVENLFITQRLDDMDIWGKGEADSPFSVASARASAFEQQILELVNIERAAVGLSPMQWCDHLGASSRAHSQDMAVARYFDHFCPLGISPFTRMNEAGVRYMTGGENIAAGSATPEGAMNQWMNSPGHRDNILNPAFNRLGVGHYNLPGSRYGNYWTQKFGGGARTVTHTTVNISVTSTAGGTASGGGTFSIGATASLTAVPNSGHTFEGWYVANTRISSNPTQNFIAAATRTIQARFSGGVVAPGVIASGQFPAGGGISGAPWRLYNDGTLIVDGGFINWAAPWPAFQTGVNSPWHNHRNIINKIEFTGPITAGISVRSLFSRLHNVTEISGLENFDTSNTVSFMGLFQGANSLRTLDLSSWNTANVTDMDSMFCQTHNLTNLKLAANWVTSNVTDLRGMFHAAHSLTSLDLSDWNTINVRYMQGMFNNALNLADLNITGWVANSVVDMESVFDGANRLTSLDLSGWGTSSVTSVRNMFRGTANLRQLTLGRYFSFRTVIGAAGLPNVLQSATFTGMWQNVGAGTVNNPLGAHVLTSQQLMNNFNGATMADTWVWQPVQTGCANPDCDCVPCDGVDCVCQTGCDNPDCDCVPCDGVDCECQIVVLPERETVADLLGSFADDADIEVLGADGNVVTDFTTPLGTGMRVTVNRGAGRVPIVMVIVVENDLDGDGEAGHSDLIELAQYIVGTGELSLAQYAAINASPNSATPTLLNRLIGLARAATDGVSYSGSYSTT